MRISSRLLSVRTIRSVLLVAVLLAALGFLLFGETFSTRVLGAIGTLVVAVLLKVVFELFSQLRRLERDVSRLTSQLADSSTPIGAEMTEVIESQERLEAMVRQTQALLDEIRQRTARLESGHSDMTEEHLRAQQRSHHRIEVLREEIGRNVGDLTIRLDDLIAAQQPVRRHVLREDVPLRELDLRDSLRGLLTEDDTGAPK